MTTIIRGIGELFRSKEKVSAPEGTREDVTVELGQTRQPAFAASQDASLAILNLGSDGKVRDDLRKLLITGLKNSLAKDKKLQEALVKDFGTQANSKREIQIAVDILDLGIPFSIKQLSLSGNSNQSLRKHLSSSPEKKVQPPDLWSKISDQSLKIILECANTVINTELGKQSSGSITEDLNLFKKEIDSLEDGKTPSALPGAALVNRGKLLLAGLGSLGIITVAGLESAGVIDIFPGVGPNRGVTPPPEKVMNDNVMSTIINFQGNDISATSQAILEKRIDQNLNNAKKQIPNLMLTPTGYYADSKELVKSNDKIIGLRVIANAKDSPTNTDSEKPVAIIYQETETSTQIGFIPIKEAKTGTLEQQPDQKITVITLPASGEPTMQVKEDNVKGSPLLEAQ